MYGTQWKAAAPANLGQKTWILIKKSGGTQSAVGTFLHTDKHTQTAMWYYYIRNTWKMNNGDLEGKFVAQFQPKKSTKEVR